MKLFITDYDGTLFIDEISLSINRKKILELHKKGVIIIISTGRSFESIKKQVSKYNIYYDYLHCADGSIIYDKNNKLINFYEMNHDIVKEILKLKDKIYYKEIQITYPNSYKSYYNEKDVIAGINIVIESDKIDKNVVNEFLNLKSTYPNYNFLVYDHGDYIYLCVKKENVNKAKSIEFMKQLLNVNNNDIYVIGDSDNDYDMIKNYHGASIINNNLNLIKISKKRYYHVYDYINDIENEL